MYLTAEANKQTMEISLKFITNITEILKNVSQFLSHLAKQVQCHYMPGCQMKVLLTE